MVLHACIFSVCFYKSYFSIFGLKNAFARDKEQGLVDYIEWVGQNNRRLNKLFKELELKDLDDNLKNVVKRGASNFWQNIINFLYAFYQSFVKTKKEAILAE